MDDIDIKNREPLDPDTEQHEDMDPFADVDYDMQAGVNLMAEMQACGTDALHVPNIPENATGDTREEESSFTQDCRDIITHVIALLEGLIRRSVWAGNPIHTHPPASDLDMGIYSYNFKDVKSVGG